MATMRPFGFPADADPLRELRRLQPSRHSADGLGCHTQTCSSRHLRLEHRTIR